MFKNRKILVLFLAASLTITGFNTEIIEAESQWALHKTAYTFNAPSGNNYYEPVPHEHGINVKYWKGSTSFIESIDSYTVSYKTEESNGITLSEIPAGTDYMDSWQDNKTVKNNQVFTVNVSGMKRPVIQVYPQSGNKTPEITEIFTNPEMPGHTGMIFCRYLQDIGNVKNYETGIAYLQDSSVTESSFCFGNRHFIGESSKEYTASLLDTRNIIIKGEVSAIYVYDYPEDYVNYNMESDLYKGSLVYGDGMKTSPDTYSRSVNLTPDEEKAINRVLENGRYSIDMNIFSDDETLSPVTEVTEVSDVYFFIPGIIQKVKDANKIKLSNISLVTSDGEIKEDNLNIETYKRINNYDFRLLRKDGKAITLKGGLQLNFNISGIEYKNPDIMLPGGNQTEKLKLKKTKFVLKEGQKAKIKITSKLNANVTYKSSDASVASVNKNGVVTAKKKGKTTISVNANGKKCKVKVTVKADPFVIKLSKDFKLSKTKATVKKGQKLVIKKASGINGKITYNSLDKKVATVSVKGVIRAKKRGRTTILAKTPKKTLKLKIIVKH